MNRACRLDQRCRKKRSEETVKEPLTNTTRNSIGSFAASSWFPGGLIFLLAAVGNYAAAILIGLGLTSSLFGKTILRMPSLYSAATLSALTANGKENERLKVPYSRSMR